VPHIAKSLPSHDDLIDYLAVAAGKRNVEYQGTLSVTMNGEKNSVAIVGAYSGAE
jgi:hypothetical protein